MNVLRNRTLGWWCSSERRSARLSPFTHTSHVWTLTSSWPARLDAKLHQIVFLLFRQAESNHIALQRRIWGVIIFIHTERGSCDRGHLSDINRFIFHPDCLSAMIHIALCVISPPFRPLASSCFHPRVEKLISQCSVWFHVSLVPGALSQ